MTKHTKTNSTDRLKLNVAYLIRIRAVQHLQMVIPFIEKQNFNPPYVVNGQELTTEEYPVPDNMVGLIIGRGGDQITKIQADTGCRVAVVPQPTGSVTRPCTLTGTTEQILGK